MLGLALPAGFPQAGGVAGFERLVDLVRWDLSKRHRRLHARSSGTVSSMIVPRCVPGRMLKVPSRRAVRVVMLLRPLPRGASAGGGPIPSSSIRSTMVSVTVSCISTRVALAWRAVLLKASVITAASSLASSSSMCASIGPSKETCGFEAQRAGRFDGEFEDAAAESWRCTVCAGVEAEDCRTEVFDREVEFVDRGVDARLGGVGIGAEETSSAFEHEADTEHPLDHTVMEVSRDAFLIVEERQALELAV